MIVINSRHPLAGSAFIVYNRQGQYHAEPSEKIVAFDKNRGIIVARHKGTNEGTGSQVAIITKKNETLQKRVLELPANQEWKAQFQGESLYLLGVDSNQKHTLFRVLLNRDYSVVPLAFNFTGQQSVSSTLYHDILILTEYSQTNNQSTLTRVNLSTGESQSLPCRGKIEVTGRENHFLFCQDFKFRRTNT